jgi:hypothetical protein
METSSILWNSKIHFRFREWKPVYYILSHLNLIHTLTFYFCKIHLDIILTYLPVAKRFPSLVYSDKISYHLLIFPMRYTYAIDLIILDLMILVM